MRRIEVGTGSGGYPVCVGHGASSLLPDFAQGAAASGRVAVVSDSNVAPIHGASIARALESAGLNPSVHTFPAGEPSKNRQVWSELSDEVLAAGLGRDGCIVTVGGGVTTDLGGFVAATFMRGVPVIHVPTSTLAMLDASVGGKVGVDVPGGKNLVGAFHAPVAVVADIAHLETLPTVDFSDGLVEGVKHGAIRSGEHLNAIRDSIGELRRDHAELSAIVAASVGIKASVVAEDEFEGGLRQILNFGHTVGHALEAAAGFGMPHGAAVALGMQAEARIGEILGVTRVGVRDELADALARLRLTPIPAAKPEALLPYMTVDKKAVGGRARFVLLEEIGRVANDGGWSREVPREVVIEALQRELK